MSAKIYAWQRVLYCLLFTSVSLILYSQDGINKMPNANINPNCNGYLEYLPAGYTASTQKYPLIIFLAGIGSTGTGSNAALDSLFSLGGNYPHEQQDNGTWPDAFTVNGQTYQPVVITPQFIRPMSSLTNMPTPEELDDILNYVVSEYRIDTTRIYLMGSSQGGGLIWDYLGDSSVYARRIAAATIFGGVSFPLEQRAKTIKHNRVAIWAFHNAWDQLVPPYFTNDYVALINQAPAPTIPARKTLFPSTEHLCWYTPLGPGYTENGLNVYQWLLQYQKPHSNAFAGYYQQLTLPTNSTQLNGAGTGPNGTTNTINWQKISGPAGGDISDPGIPGPTISNLQQGKYVYRLSLTDNAAQTATSEVEILVDPAAQRIEAEAYTSASGVSLETTSDEGGGQNVGFIDTLDYMDYTVTVPTAGQYKMRFRIASQAWNAQFVVRNSGGTVLDTVDVFETGGWQTWLTRTVTIPLNAGAQTIRLQSSRNGSWNINWLEVETVALAPLPVRLVFFNASCSNGAVNLVWKTEGERDSKNFIIERSHNGRDWTAAGTVAAAGQSTEQRSYQFTDQQNPAGFYRLVQQDIDGKLSYSAVLRNPCTRTTGLSVYPNPASNKLSLTISLQQAAHIRLTLTDSRGAVVRRQQNQLLQGTNQLDINLSGLAKGTYLLLAEWEGESRTVKVVKE